MIRITTALVLMLTVFCVHAQVTVNGSVTDSLGKPLQSVSITLKKANGIILSFAITNALGSYKVQHASASVKDTLVVEANAIGYKKQSSPLTNALQSTNFKLAESSTKLPNVTVKSSPLRKEGDTLNYDVNSFSTPQDRVIGDIIKKLPGVEVAQNGEISYLGKPINRFYIDNDNLLDGRYNAAMKGIPNDMVAKVQILENHQPINALKDVQKTDEAAINIVLKDKARLKIMGTGDAAFGTPSVYNGTVNAMLFQKKVKFMNYIKMNNMGVDVSEETINHFGGENVQPLNLLSAGGGGSPDLMKRRYLFNNVGLINGNDLLNLKKDHTLRINAYYTWDRQFQSSQSSSTYFLPNDTIRYAEKQDNRITTNALNTQFTLTANRKDYYLNNVTVLENKPTDILASLQATGNGSVNQNLNGVVTSFSNKFSIIRKSNTGKVLEAYSSISHVSNPATLFVEPGLYPAQFNNNIAYAGLSQYAAVPTFYTDNYVSFGRSTAKFQQQYKTGINYQDQDLNSLLESQQLSGTKGAVADSFINRLHWVRMNIYAQADLTYTSGAVMLRATLPLSLQDTKYTGRLTHTHTSNPLFTPRLYLKYNTGREAFITLGYNYGNTYGGISQVYDSYIMKGYRNFFTNGPLLNESSTHTITAGYTFKNTLKIFFLNLGGSYTSNTSNTINDSRISTVLQQSRLIPFENAYTATQLFATISKYIFPLMTTIGGKIAWSRAVSNSLQNGDLLQNQNDAYTYNLNITSKLSSWLNFSYAGNYNTFGAKPVGNTHTTRPASPRVDRWQHEAYANFSISPIFYFKLSGDNYRYIIPGTQDNNYTFLDAAFTYKINKLKTDLELSLTNLANVDSYSSATLTTNSIFESSYRIRPRMAMIKFYFRF